MFGKLKLKKETVHAFDPSLLHAVRVRPDERFERWLELARIARPLLQNALVALDDFETRITAALAEERKKRPPIVSGPRAVMDGALNGAIPGERMSPMPTMNHHARNCPACGAVAPVVLQFLGTECVGCSQCNARARSQS